MTTQGLNFPHLVFVLSMAFPINGSMNSSHIRMTTISVVTMATILSSKFLLPVLNK